MSIHPERPPLKQSQVEAIFDLLLLGMYADARLLAIENSKVFELVSGLEWTSYQDPQEYSNLAIARVRAASETHVGTENFLIALNEQLETEDARSFALTLLVQVVSVDQEISADEVDLLQRARRAFGLSHASDLSE